MELDCGSTMFCGTFLEISCYSLVAYDWARPLTGWIESRKCLEIMCGYGCLAKALRDCGVDIIATDDFSWANHEVCWFQNPWMDIEQLSAIDTVKKYGWISDIVILSWPYRDCTAYEVLLEMWRQNPSAQMIFLGEWNGATANRAFFDAAQPVDDASFRQTVSNYRRHAMMKD